MRWRKFNGDPIEIPILKAVENAIKRETEAGFRLKVCIGTDSPNVLKVHSVATTFTGLTCSDFLRGPAPRAKRQRELARRALRNLRGR